MLLGLNVYPRTFVSSTCVVSTRLKIVAMLGVLKVVAKICMFVSYCDQSFESPLHLHNLKYYCASFDTNWSLCMVNNAMVVCSSRMVSFLKVKETLSIIVHVWTLMIEFLNLFIFSTFYTTFKPWEAFSMWFLGKNVIWWACEHEREPMNVSNREYSIVFFDTLVEYFIKDFSTP
jgi:hypothetical protein